MPTNYPKPKSKYAAGPNAFDEVLKGYSGPQNLLDEMRKTVSALGLGQANAGKVDMDSTINEYANSVRKARVMRTAVDGPVANLATTIDQVTKGLHANEAELHKHLSYDGDILAGISVANAVREHVKALAPAERSKFIGHAISTYDLLSLKAVVGVPAFLSGLVDAEHGQARDQYLQTVAPEQVARTKSLRDGLAFAQNFQTQLLQAIGDTVDFASADAIAASASAA
jgi:hypothetical protein